MLLLSGSGPVEFTYWQTGTNLLMFRRLRTSRKKQKAPGPTPLFFFPPPRRVHDSYSGNAPHPRAEPKPLVWFLFYPG